MCANHNFFKLILFIIFLCQYRLNIAQNTEKKQKYTPDTCINIFYKGKIGFEECYVNDKLVMHTEFDTLGNKSRLRFFINDSITVVTNYYSNGNVKSIYEKCTNTGAEKGLYTGFFDNGKLKEIGCYIPNSCNCSTEKIISIDDKFGFGFFIYRSRKVDTWVEYNENGEKIKMIKYD